MEPFAQSDFGIGVARFFGATPTGVAWRFEAAPRPSIWWGADSNARSTSAERQRSESFRLTIHSGGNAAAKVPPGNHLEALKGDRLGQHSIRINDQWRVCFAWTAQGPTDVEIVDYH